MNKNSLNTYYLVIEKLIERNQVGGCYVINDHMTEMLADIRSQISVEPTNLLLLASEIELLIALKEISVSNEYISETHADIKAKAQTLVRIDHESDDPLVKLARASGFYALGKLQYASNDEESTQILNFYRLALINNEFHWYALLEIILILFEEDNIEYRAMLPDKQLRAEMPLLKAHFLSHIADDKWFKGEREEAYGIWQQALEIYPLKNTDNLVRMAWCHVNKKEYQKAVDLVIEAARIEAEYEIAEDKYLVDYNAIYRIARQVASDCDSNHEDHVSYFKLYMLLDFLPKDLGGSFWHIVSEEAFNRITSIEMQKKISREAVSQLNNSLISEGVKDFHFMNMAAFDYSKENGCKKREGVPDCFFD